MNEDKPDTARQAAPEGATAPDRSPEAEAVRKDQDTETTDTPGTTPDTAPAETGPAETGPEETAPEETGAEETGAEDTAPQDTAPLTLRPEDAVPSADPETDGADKDAPEGDAPDTPDDAADDAAPDTPDTEQTPDRDAATADSAETSPDTAPEETGAEKSAPQNTAPLTLRPEDTVPSADPETDGTDGDAVPDAPDDAADDTADDAAPGTPDAEQEAEAEVPAQDAAAADSAPEPSLTDAPADQGADAQADPWVVRPDPEDAPDPREDSARDDEDGQPSVQADAESPVVTSEPPVAAGFAPLPPPPQRPRPACAAAVFGKLPARGDFISRNVPRALQRPFEDWLIPLVQETRAELGATWNATWRAAGPWRFWIGPEVLGGSWQRDLRKPVHEQGGSGGAMTGVMLPSADRHGRDFPLVLLLADPLARLMPPPVTTAPDRRWYDLCDTFLYAARAGADIGTIEAELDRLPGPVLPEGAEAMDALLARQALWAQGNETTEDGASMIWQDIAQADHHLAAGGRSYWWQAPSGQAATRALSLAGLPDAGTFAFMLSQGHPNTADPSS